MNAVIFTTLVLCLSLGNSAIISVSEDGGYSNIVVAIGNEVDEDDRLLTAITELLTNASSFLYTATKGTVYFEQVTVVIPSSWSPKSQYAATQKDYSEDGHVIITDKENDEPLTVQPGDCGEPGERIELTPNYLLNMNDPYYISLNGHPHKRFVKEWAKFRYGVFDESVTPKAARDDSRLKTYYIDEGNIHPSTCTKDIGSVGDFLAQNMPCDPSKEKNCVYKILDSIYVTDEASIMYSTAYDSINSFCNETQHNKKADNLHKLKCQFKSTWEVITSHDDFKNEVPPSVVPRDTIPKFRFLRAVKSSGKTVMVLDISGSMQGVPIQLLHRSTTRHVLKFAPDGSELGIVVFSNNAIIKQRMTKVTNATRGAIASQLPSQVGGATAIGRGLQTGLEVLLSSDVAEGGVILLVTDGEENVEPSIESVLPSIIRKGVVVNVIAYGTNASEKLEKVALMTGGTATIFKDIKSAEANVDELAFKILEATASQADIEFKPQKVKSEKLVFRDSEELTLDVPLDSDLGKNTVFSFSWNYNVRPDIQLVSPTGKQFDRFSDKFSGTEKHVEYKFETAETGIWKIIVRKQPTENVDISLLLVSAPADSKVKPVIVKAFLNGFDVDFARKKTIVKAYAEIYKAKQHVLGCVVTGLFNGPDDTIEIPLTDDGKGGDSIADDGFYTGVLTEFNANGRYLFTAKVFGGSDVRIRKEHKIGKRSIDSTDDVQDYDMVPMHSMFERLSEGGVIVVRNWSPNLPDTTKPARVVDLDVKNSSFLRGVRTVSLTWTASGDDFFSGNASRLEIALSVNHDSLFENFEDQWKANISYLLEGSISPTEGGVQTAATLLIPEELFVERGDNATSTAAIQQVFIALRYIDEAKNEGDISNIVSVLLIKDVTPPATVVDLTISNVTRDDEGFNFTLSWTAAGDDLWEGIADLLELRVSSLQDDLSLHFTEQTKINAQSLLNGTLLPVEGGTQMEISLSLPKDSFQNVTHLYFGLKYFDEEGNEGNVSNIVQFELNPIAFSEGEMKKGRMKRETHVIIIGVIIAMLFILGVLSGLFYFLKRSKPYQLVTMYKSNI